MVGYFTGHGFLPEALTSVFRINSGRHYYRTEKQADYAKPNSMIFNIFTSQGSIHQICHRLANDLHLPVPYVCYLLFQELYRRDIKTAIAFFIESDLFGFLLKHKGEFDLMPVEGGEQIAFKDGSTIGPKDSTFTWEQFFRIFYMEYSENRRQLLMDQLTEYLDTEFHYQ